MNILLNKEAAVVEHDAHSNKKVLITVRRLLYGLPCGAGRHMDLLPTALRRGLNIPAG